MNTLQHIAFAVAVLVSAPALGGPEASDPTVAFEVSSAGLDASHVYFNPWGAWSDPALERFVVAEHDRVTMSWPATIVRAAELQTTGGGVD